MGLDSGLRQGLGAGFHGSVVESGPFGPPPAFAHAGNALEEPLRQPESLQAGFEALVEFTGRNDDWCLHTGDGKNCRVGVSKRCIAAQYPAFVQMGIHVPPTHPTDAKTLQPLTMHAAPWFPHIHQTA
ncbi:hypothetical protein GCM10009596_10820 [Arthrobacter rhombi]